MKILTREFLPQEENDSRLNVSQAEDHDKEEVYDEFSKDELNNFIDQLNSEQFEKIQEFYDTAPKLSHTMKVTNPNTKVENDVVIEGLQSFLG